MGTNRQCMVSVASVFGVPQADFRTHQHCLQLLCSKCSSKNRLCWPIYNRLRSVQWYFEPQKTVRTNRQCVVSVASVLGVVWAYFRTHQNCLQLLCSKYSSRNRLSLPIYNHLRSVQWHLEAHNTVWKNLQHMVRVASVFWVIWASFKTHQYCLQLLCSKYSSRKSLLLHPQEGVQSFVRRFTYKKEVRGLIHFFPPQEGIVYQHTILSIVWSVYAKEVRG